MTCNKSNTDVYVCFEISSSDFQTYLDVFDVDKFTSMKFNLVVMWNCTTLTATTTVCICFSETVERCAFCFDNQPH